MTAPTVGPFDFFASGALPAPVLDEADAAALATEQFGLRARARALGSQQDANFLLTDPDDGTVLGVLKVCNAAFGPAEIGAQSAAAEHLGRRAPALRVATTVPRPDGYAAVTLPSGDVVVARILRWLPGGTLSG